MSSGERPSVAHQYRFGEDEDGEAELQPEESTEVSLEEFGADIDHRNDNRESRIERPKATEFGVDDRVEVRSSEPAESGRQTSLVPDPEQARLTDTDTETE